MHDPKRKQKTKNSEVPLRLIPLGGMGEIGKNLTVLEYGEDIILVDCGLKFPEEDMLGIDFVIPDAQYLVENKDRIKALFLTHGHEDHIGAIPFILPKIDVPVYGTPLTLGLVANKMLDARTNYKPTYNNIHPGESVKVGAFDVSFISVCHSIPDAIALAIKTPIGLVVHTGDFKLDATPIGGIGTDYAAFAELGKQGVMMLLSDSTNSEREGFTASERTVGQTFEQLFRLHKDRRIVIATFASNIYRAQQIFSVAARFNRKVVLMGRSMLAYVDLAQKLGYIDAPEGLIIPPQEADLLPPNRCVVLTTGSQGEPFSGLVLMSKGEHRQIRLGERDLVIVSATPIPGNEKLVSHTINNLFACGCEVIYEKGRQIHVSGHASREEQKIMLNLVKPKYFVPCHGENRHLMRHAQLAREMGIPSRNTFILNNGDVISINSNKKVSLGERVTSGAVLVDGMTIGECEGSLLKERRELSEDGLISVSLALDAKMQLVSPILLSSKGSIFDVEGETLKKDLERAVTRALDAFTKGTDQKIELLHTEIRKKIRDVLSRFARSYPTIIPHVIQLDSNVDSHAKPTKPRRRKTSPKPETNSDH